MYYFVIVAIISMFSLALPSRGKLCKGTASFPFPQIFLKVLTRFNIQEANLHQTPAVINFPAAPPGGPLLKSECKGRTSTLNLQIYTLYLTVI